MSRPGTTAETRTDRDVQTDTGAVRIHTRAVPGAPMVALRAWLPGGARLETTPGCAMVTGRLLTEGTRRRDWRTLADDLEARGMGLDGNATFDCVKLSLDALASDWREALEWLLEMLLEPAFDEDRGRWLRRQVAGELESLGDRPEIRTAWAFMEHLYAPHPKQRPVQGTAAGLAALGNAECAAFHQRGLERGLILAVAGDVDPDAVAERAGELTRALPRGTGSDPEPPAPRGLEQRRREVRFPRGEAESDQAHLFAGHRTLPRRHRDYEALELAGVVLGAGAGLTGRIPERIREREGLAYAVQTHTVAGAGLDPGRLLIYVGTASATVDQAARGVEEEIRRLVEDGISESELEDARSYLLGREPFERETARQQARRIAQGQLYGVPLDRPGWREERLAALDLEEVLRAVREHLHPGDLRLTMGLPEG